MRAAVLSSLVAAALAGSAEEWKSRSVYQVLTDRFATAATSCDLSDYCGGTFQDLENNLDYIQGAGFDAVWISPVVANTPGGYHGYWAQNLTATNENFGSPDELKSLVKAMHARDMWVMLDVVGNHMGGLIGDIGGFSPFDDASDYHDCDGCPSDCNIADYNDPAETEHCRLAGLPDLDQDDASVRQQLLDWISWMVKEYDVDGLRVDTVPEVKPAFWQEFNQAAGTYAVGEVFNGDVGYVSSFQGAALDALLSYPMFYTMRDVFQSQGSMFGFEQQTQAYADAFADPTILGTFLDNHDNARFMNAQSDKVLYRNAITYTLASEGIPIVYYGTEQYFDGGNDPECRELLPASELDTSTDMYQLIKAVNEQRAASGFWAEPQVQRYAADDFYAFTRGDTLVALTNVGSDGADVEYTITYHDYDVGTTLCSIFDAEDCTQVAASGIDVVLSGGEPKVLAPQTS